MTALAKDNGVTYTTHSYSSSTEVEWGDALPRLAAEREVDLRVEKQRLLQVNSEAPDIDTSSEVIPMPTFRKALKNQKVFSASKEWEGVVISISETKFFAELREVTSSSDATDMIEIPLNDVPKLDRTLLRQGAIFRYLVGYAKNYGGTLSMKRHVYIRRGKSKKQFADKEAYWVGLFEKLGG